MEQLFHYLLSSWINIKRAPLPYLLTIFIMSLGLGIFFSNATFYYWLQHDPLPHKSDTLFYPRIANFPNACNQCDAPRSLSYRDAKLLSSSGIPTATAAMFSADGYVRTDENRSAMAANIRFTQRDFFNLFDVPMMAGQIWPDNDARMEAILSKHYAITLFGTADVVGKTLLVDDRIYSVVAVLDSWAMRPKLYDVDAGAYREPVEDIYLPLELGYDFSYRANRNTQAFEPVNPGRIPTEGRERAYHRLQFWVELNTPQQQQAYRLFMHNLVADEKKAGRHADPEANRLHSMSQIMAAFHIEDSEVKAFFLVTLLFLVVCLLNANHLSMSRYMANQYEFSLRRALGASRSQIYQQLFVDILITSFFSLAVAAAIAWASMELINSLLPANQHFAQWSLPLMLWLVLLTVLANFVVALYPAVRTAFGHPAQQLKS